MEEQLGRLADNMAARMEKRLDSLDRAAKRRRTTTEDSVSPVKTPAASAPRARPADPAPTPESETSAAAHPRPATPPPRTVNMQPPPPKPHAHAPAYYRDEAGKKDREYVPYVNTYLTPAAQCSNTSRTTGSKRTPFYESISPNDGSDDERTEAVNNLLAVTGTSSKARGNHILAPHRYIVRPGRTARVGMNQASLPEYIVALCKMLRDKSLPTSWLEPVQDHIMHLASMACTYEWPTCRQWSESVFVMIADGSLPYGWNDLYAIKDLQRDHTNAANNRHAQRSGRTARSETANSDASYNTAAASRDANPRRAERTEYSRPTYSKETNGKICGQWNRDEDCGNSATHGTMPDRYCHVCAWCANKYQKANPHQEKNCQNKKRFLDRKNGEKRQTTDSQDFR